MRSRSDQVRRRFRFHSAALAALLLAVLAAPAAGADNPWLGQRLLNFAHQGGEFEHPSNTMYAFKRAYVRGADVLELDIHTTKDGEIVVIHDSSVDRTTNGSGSVYDVTLAELRALDAAHNFIPGRNAVRGQRASAYPFRGVRTGKRPPPSGYAREDFRIPTLREVFRAFPDTPINIEIKGESDADPTTYLRNAEALAAFLNAARRTDLIVVSFHDEATDRFHQLAPQIPTAPGLAKVAAYVETGAPLGGDYDALQVPPRFSGITVVTPEFVRRAHRDGYAVHVWIASSEEYESFYADQFGMCVDAIMTAYPARLEGAMRRRGYLRPGRGGIDPCGRDRPQAAGRTLHVACRQARARGEPEGEAERPPARRLARRLSRLHQAARRPQDDRAREILDRPRRTGGRHAAPALEDRPATAPPAGTVAGGGEAPRRGSATDASPRADPQARLGRPARHSGGPCRPPRR